MDRFSKYVHDLFQWNEEMKKFLETENARKDSAELWGKLDGFTEVMENLNQPMTDQDLLELQAKAEVIQAEMEGYFTRKQDAGNIWVVGTVLSPGSHRLPNLPYEYSALEPYFSEQMMKLHHQHHHLVHVDELNRAELQLKKARETNDYRLLKHWSRELSFHGSGHYLHMLFWNNLSPAGGGKPNGRLLKEIESYFGSFAAFKKHFTEAAIQVEGNGWALLVWSPRARHLEIVQTQENTHYAQWDTIPLLAADVWEHAYSLQYKQKREEYVENWWKIVNWSEVERRFEQASELKWQAY
ncbi:superoxide dismutase [Neobacillus sp. SM06]|uniref:superoxide dismutase n=1 Tax=Neobacillus sp. SM06 TaxID=3422492 RepID=UPI003D2953E8